MKSMYVIPIIFVVFGLMSSTILMSIAPSLVKFQIFFFLIGAIIILLGSQIPIVWWKKATPVLYLLSITLLTLTLFLSATRGSRGWIPLGPFNLQPSQISQPIILLSLALWLENHSLKKIKTVLHTAVLLAIPWVLIVVEPDLGTAMITALALILTFFHTDLPKHLLAIGFAVAIALGIIGWTFFLHPYQKERVTSFLHPTDLQGAGYNAYQSIVAVGSGQVVGRGLGHGVQSQLRFLPERQTDFIFASLAEETGFTGSVFLLSGYLTLILWIMHLAYTTHDQLSKITLFGIGYLLCCQIFVNVGMNMRLLPITGITLPFISYGGSSLLSFSLMLSFAQRVLLEKRHNHTVVFDGKYFQTHRQSKKAVRL